MFETVGFVVRTNRSPNRTKFCVCQQRLLHTPTKVTQYQLNYRGQRLLFTLALVSIRTAHTASPWDNGAACRSAAALDNSLRGYDLFKPSVMPQFLSPKDCLKQTNTTLFISILPSYKQNHSRVLQRDSLRSFPSCTHCESVG